MWRIWKADQVAGSECPIFQRSYSPNQNIERLVSFLQCSRGWGIALKLISTRETLPAELRPGLLALLLELLGSAISPLNPYSFQPGNGIVIRKLFGCVCSSYFGLSLVCNLGLIYRENSWHPYYSDCLSISSQTRSLPFCRLSPQPQLKAHDSLHLSLYLATTRRQITMNQRNIG